MSRFSKYVREKVVKVLVTALVVGSVAGNEGIAVQAAGADLNDPFSFVLLHAANRPNFSQLSIILAAFPFCKRNLSLFTDLLKA